MQVVYTARQKLHWVAPTKIGCVNGPLPGLPLSKHTYIGLPSSHETSLLSFFQTYTRKFRFPQESDWWIECWYVQCKGGKLARSHFRKGTNFSMCAFCKKWENWEVLRTWRYYIVCQSWQRHKCRGVVEEILGVSEHSWPSSRLEESSRIRWCQRGERPCKRPTSTNHISGQRVKLILVCILL